MRPAVEGLKATVAAAAIEAPRVPVVGNASAQPLRDASAVRAELGLQVDSPVRWHESVRTMADSGVTSFIEFGPGKVLTGLVRRIVPGATISNVSTLADAAGKPEATAVAP
jgi:[acyl-carrier-protein] S-malonyltransferase